MSATAKALLDQFLALSEDEQELFLIEAEHAVASEPDADKAWIEEAEQRLDEHLAGDGKAEDWNVVKQRLRHEFGR